MSASFTRAAADMYPPVPPASVFLLDWWNLPMLGADCAKFSLFGQMSHNCLPNVIHEPPSLRLTYKFNMHCEPLSLNPIHHRHLLGDWYAVVGIGLEACELHYDNSARRTTNFITVAHRRGQHEADCVPVLDSLSESRQGPLDPNAQPLTH